jgi:uncharacterized phage-associated protein
MVEKTHAVAKNIIEHFASEHQKISIRKLNILTYICNGFFLAKHNSCLLQEPVLLDWTGPKLNGLYLENPDGFLVFNNKPINKLCTKEIAVISKVIEKYGDLATVGLVQEARLPRTPWSITWNFYKNRKIQATNISISNDLIKHHYEQMASKRHHCGF